MALKGCLRAAFFMVKPIMTTVVATGTTLVCAATCVALVWNLRRGHWRVAAACKLAASAAMIATALALGAPSHIYGQWVVAGLVLSAVGDALLLSDRERWFLAGLGSFLLAHVAYATAFVLQPLSANAGWFALAVMGMVVLITWRWLRQHLRGTMRPAVAAYLGVIGVMVAMAVASAAVPGARPGAMLAAVSAVAFAASDVAVARERFVAASWINRAWGLPLYFAAQLGLAWSTCQAC